MCLRCEMCQSLDTLTYEVKSIRVPLAVEKLEVDDPLEEKFVCNE